MDCVTLCTSIATQARTCRQHIYCPRHQVPKHPLHLTPVSTRVTRLALRCLPVARDHTIGMTTEAFSISKHRGPVGSEIKVDGLWVSPLLMAYKQATVSLVMNRIPEAKGLRQLCIP